jgi:hypothetical protein
MRESKNLFLLLNLQLIEFFNKFAFQNAISFSMDKNEELVAIIIDLKVESKSYDMRDD